MFPRAYRLRITLQDVEPPVWRLLDLPADATFWELHVAIQDAMGWEDRHLHVFRPLAMRGPEAPQIGIPDPDLEDDYDADWEVDLAAWLAGPGDACEYVYDFGDDWRHLVEVVERPPAPESDSRTPRLLDGENACPPEDCGGAPGYAELLRGSGGAFDATAFDPSEVEFSNAAWRLAQVRHGR